jgi:hypothetical protein
VRTLGLPRGRRLVADIAVATIIGISVGVAIFAMRPVPNPFAYGDRSMLQPMSPEVLAGSHVSLTDTLRGHDQTVRIDERDKGRILDHTPITCHGGRARVVWHVGNLEPTRPETGIGLTARFDGVPIGSLIRGSTMGVWNDAPVSIQAVVDCPAGPHVLDLEVTFVNGSWGIPYVVSPDGPRSPNLVINRGFVVEEIW